MTVPVGYPLEDKEILVLDEKGIALRPRENWRDRGPQSFSFTRLLEQARSHGASVYLGPGIGRPAFTGLGIWAESWLTVASNI